ncbi:MAG: helix-turn-helix domain-containing protein [Bacillota bacterium]
MKYEEIPDHLLLNYKLLKIVIFEETKAIFEDRPYIMKAWKLEAYHMTSEEIQREAPGDTMRPSFRALFFLFTQTLCISSHITKSMIREAVIRHKDTIKMLIAGHLHLEFPNEEIKRSVNEEKISEALERDYIYSSMDMDFHLMRDIVTKKKDYTEGETGHLTTEIIDNKGKIRGLAELRPYNTRLDELSSDQQEIWLELIESTLSSLDEMTADLFDLITYLWMVTPKSPDGYIEFHSNDALRLRNLKKRSSLGREIDFREEDRFNIMKRVAALSSIWVSMGEQKIKVINTQDIKDKELYKFKDFQKMFEIGKIRVAYDKQTNEAKGIYALQIKPTSILTPYLEGPNRSIGVLDLKVFQYSHFTQREQKRLTRYLNLQWKIRTINRSLNQPFKVSTLLKVMDFSARYNGVQIRDKFEAILDELQQDEVLKSWKYTEEIQEEKVGKKGWFKNYWEKLNIVLLPTEIVVKENQNNLLTQTQQNDYEKRIEQIHHVNTQKREAPPFEFFLSERTQHETAATIQVEHEKNRYDEPQEEQQSFDLDEESSVNLTPETMKETIDSLGMSIRQSALEIGIAHTTLSRYIRKENKRQNKNNDEKMLKWLREKINTQE